MWRTGVSHRRKPHICVKKGSTMVEVNVYGPDITLGISYRLVVYGAVKPSVTFNA